MGCWLSAPKRASARTLTLDLKQNEMRPYAIIFGWTLILVGLATSVFLAVLGVRRFRMEPAHEFRFRDWFLGKNHMSRNRPAIELFLDAIFVFLCVVLTIILLN